MLGGPGKASDNMTRINIVLGEKGAPFTLIWTKRANLFFHDCRRLYIYAWELCIKAMHTYILKTSGTTVFVLLKKIKIATARGELALPGWIGIPGGVNWPHPKIQ